MTVDFIRKSEEPYATSADVLIDGNRQGEVLRVK